MTQDCSHPSSTADVNPCQSKSLPKGINIIEADENSAPRVEVVSKSEEEAPWGYIFLRHYLVESFEKKLKTLRAEGKHVPNSFIHRTTDYKRKPNGKGVMKTEKPTISGLVFLQGETEQPPLSLKIISPVTISSIIAPRKCRHPSSTAS